MDWKKGRVGRSLFQAMNYCTLFDSHYLSRGLALYDSLMQGTKDFHLYILAFDESAYKIVTYLDLPQVTVIRLEECETAELKKIKTERSRVEYCWTFTPVIIEYCLEHYDLPSVCYLDADLYFWGSANQLIQDAPDPAVIITDHYYSPEYDNSALSGKYCVQFMYFKNTPEGRAVLTTWRQQCLEWCYDRVEEGRFGDQKYLDNWPELFSGVHVLQNRGAGVAPWNVQQYDIVVKDEKPDVVFYHFHALKFINDKIHYGHYKLSPQVKHIIYYPYVRKLLTIEKQLREDPLMAVFLRELNIHGVRFKKFSWIEWLRDRKHTFQRIHNTYPLAHWSR